MFYAQPRKTAPSQLGNSGALAPRRATASGAGPDTSRPMAWPTEPFASASRKRSALAIYPKLGPITAKLLRSWIAKWVIGCLGRLARALAAAGSGEEGERLSPSLRMGALVARVPLTRQKDATWPIAAAKWWIVFGLHGQIGAAAPTVRPRGTASAPLLRCQKKAVGHAAQQSPRRRRGARGTPMGRRIVPGQIGALSACAPRPAATQR